MYQCVIYVLWSYLVNVLLLCVVNVLYSSALRHAPPKQGTGASSFLSENFNFFYFFKFFL